MSRPHLINFDYSAGYPVDPEVFEAMRPYFYEKYGNPASLHRLGGEVRAAFEEAQLRVGRLIGCESPTHEIYFTSGATESNNLALKGFAFKNRKKGNHLIISSIEHISVINISKYLEKNGFTVTRIPVDGNGVVDMDALRNAMTDETILVSVMFANNEIGTVEPIREIGQIARERKIALHVDGTAAVGKTPVDVVRDNIDMLTLSSNDLYGPKGVGGLYVRRGVFLEPVLQGGGQQRGVRSGSEDIPGIVGFGKAGELADRRMPEESRYVGGLRDRLMKGVLEAIEECYIHGHPTRRLPNIALIRIFGVEGEAMITELDEEGIAISTGSACASKTLSASHVLEAIGLNEIQRHGALQFSLSRWNREEDVDTLLTILPGIVKRLRDISPVWRYKERFLELYTSREEEEHIEVEKFSQI